MRRKPRLALGLALLAPVASRAQAPPVFSVGVDVVAVDVSVLDGDGRPIPGLGLEDFALTVDGRPRRLLSAELVSFEGGQAPAPAPPGPLLSNEGVRPGRLVLLAIDTGSLSPGSGRAVMQTAARLLDVLGPHDRVGLVTFPPPGQSIEPGPDLGPVRAALAKVAGRSRVRPQRVSVSEAMAYASQDEFRWNPVRERECSTSLEPNDREACLLQLENEAFALANTARAHASQVVAALRAVFSGLEPVEGLKIVVLLSGGMSVTESSDVRDLATRAARARITLHVLQLEQQLDASDLRPRDDDDRIDMEQGLSALAALSRGSLQRVVGSGAKAFERVSREIQAHYLLGFEPEAADRDGRDHQIKVSVARPGASVRTRRQVSIPVLTAPRTAPELLASALSAPFALGELRLRAGVFQLPSLDGKRPRVLVGVEAGQAGDQAGSVLAGAVLLDAQGRSGASGSLPARADGPRGASSAGLVLQAAAGAWTLRVAAVDERGRRGRADRALELRTSSRGKLEVSDLIFTPPSLAPGAGLRPMLEVDPTRAPAAVYAELAAAQPAEIERAAPSFELAVSETGPALVSQRLVPRPLAARRAAVQALLPADLLPPGEYVARLTLTGAGAPVTRALRVTLPASPAEAEQRARALRPAADFLAGLLPPFKREDALQPELLQALFARLESQVGGLGGKPANAVARARAGDWTGMLAALGNEGEAGLAFAFLRGLALYANGQSNAAASQLRAAGRVSSDFFGIPLYLGACLATLGQEGQAVGAWQTALIGEGSKQPALYRLLADSLLRTDQAAGAADLLEEALAAWPQDATLVRRKALALALQGERGKALELLARSAQEKADPNLLWAILRLRFQDYLAGGGDNQALARDAQAYLAAGGPRRELVKLWLERLGSEPR